MKQIHFLFLLAISYMVIPSVSLAETEFEGVIRNDFVFQRQRNEDESKTTRDSLHTQETYIKLSNEVSNHIRVALALELNRSLRQNGRWSPQESININTLLRDATIEIHDVSGYPVAFIIGKQEIAFGQGVAGMPSYTQSGLYNTLGLNRVVGLTVRIDKKILNIIESIESSVFSSEGDASVFKKKLGRIDSFSFRLRGEVKERLQYTASAMFLGNKHLNHGFEENRYSIGLLYTDEKKTWMTWIEGVYHDDKKNPNYGENAHFGFCAGISRNIGPGNLVTELTYIQNLMTEWGLGYKLKATRNMNIGPEIRLTQWKTPDAPFKNDLRFGLAIEILLGERTATIDDEVLFGKDKKNDHQTDNKALLKKEIETRVFDDKSIEYINKISKNLEEYNQLRKKVLEQSWALEAEAIAREKIWENAGKKLSLSIRKNHYRDLLRRRLEAEKDTGVESLRQILGNEISPNASDQEVLLFRRLQHQARVMTELRSLFAQATQNKLLSLKSAHMISPKAVEARYKELSAYFKNHKTWQTFTSTWLTEEAAQKTFQQIKSKLGTHGSPKKEQDQTFWEIQSLNFIKETYLLRIEKIKVPHELENINLKNINTPRAYVVISKREDSMLRIEIWIASFNQIPELKEAYGLIEKTLRTEEQQEILTKEFLKMSKETQETSH
jgi:hypothetical protein